MCPKFRGNSDDWLDEEDALKRRGAIRKPVAKNSKKGDFLPLEEGNATVVEVYPKLCRVRFDDGSGEVLCAYRRAQVMGAKAVETGGQAKEIAARERTPVAVGDRVKARSTSPDSGIVEGVCVRKNFLSRHAPGRDTQELQHVIAANLDLLVIVASAAEPAFSPGLVDRYLVAASSAGIPALICLTKRDRVEGDAERGDEELPAGAWEIYQSLEIPLVATSSKSEKGIAALKPWIEAKTVAFCGQSGVGKTSLLRKLCREDLGKVSEISSATQKGRHTTTSAAMLAESPEGSRWIDTPGVREFGLFGIEPSKLREFFPELSASGCDLDDCLHAGDPGCKAIPLPRHASYLRIYNSLLAGEN